MEKLPYVYKYQDLLVYKKTLTLSKEIHQITKHFPVEELYSLTSQIRRSSRSVGAQISESWAKRAYRKHFISKLTDADAELNETEHWVLVAHNCGYISQDQKQALVNQCDEIGRMIGSMISKSTVFCKEHNQNRKTETENNF